MDMMAAAKGFANLEKYNLKHPDVDVRMKGVKRMMVDMGLPDHDAYILRYTIFFLGAPSLAEAGEWSRRQQGF